jgi:hypothetical protein
VANTIGIVLVAPFAASGDEDGNASANEIGRYCRELVVLARRPAVFESDALAFDVAIFGQPAEECGHREAVSSADLACRKPITGMFGCCAFAARGHPAAPPSSVMNSGRLTRSPRRRGRAAWLARHSRVVVI